MTAAAPPSRRPSAAARPSTSPEAITGTGSSAARANVTRVVGAAAVKLRRRPRVDAHGGCAGGDEPGRQSAPELVAVAQPERILTVTGTPRPGAAPPPRHHGGDDGGGAVRLREQRRAGAGLDDLAHGAGHVEVHEVGAGGHGAPGGVGEHVGVGAEELEAERVLVLAAGEVVERAPVVVVHAVGRDHLGEDEAGAPAAHAAPEAPAS